jgi:predicted ATPase/DNA-binding SARP family transcriptional activator
MSRLALYLLGPPRIELDGEEIHIGRRKAVALLAYLAVTGGSHSRDSLATLLWPEYDQSRARAYLRHALSLLNRTLGSEWLTADRQTAGLNLDAGLWLDVDQFRSLLSAWQDHGHPEADICPECLDALAEAVELYQGDFLAGFTLRDSAMFDEFQFFQTEGLKDQLASGLERLVRWHSDQSEYEPAIELARRWLALDPLHEPVHRHLMALYAQAGRHSAALRQYRTCLRGLEEELDLPPSAETTALYERIRAERARPPEAEVAPPPSPPPAPAHLPAFLIAEERPAAVERAVFVARERELARLDRYLDTALAGQGQVVFVTGGPGRGKTALMHEFARRAMEVHPDLLVASGNCNAYSGVGDPYLPFREVLGMLTGDVEGRWAAGTISRDHARRLWAGLPLALQALVEYGPSLIGTILSDPALLSRATAVAPEGAIWLPELRGLSAQERAGHSGLEQSALFHQVTNVLRTLADAHPLLLVLDDVQWADGGSIGLLFHLGRRLEGGRILIACAYRPEEVTLGRDGEPHPLKKVLAEFKRSFGNVWMDLRQVDETQGRSFVDEFLDTEPNRLGEDFRNELFQRTGGHPLFTVELLRAMQERGDLVQDEAGQWIEGPALDCERLPVRVEAVIAARVGQLGEELREVLAVASVEGERFIAQVIAQVQGLPEREVLRALSRELGARHRLVREGEEVQVDGRFLSHYQFAHALFQEYLYRGLSGGERRLLHGEIAAALERLYGDQTTEIVTQLAHHYAEAGQTEKAIAYALCAGDQARLAYADEEAVMYFHRALALLGPSPTLPVGNKEGAWRLEALAGLGELCHRSVKDTEAEAYLRESIALGREMEVAPRELVRLYHWLGEVLHWQGRHDDRIRIGEEGLALLGDDAESVEAALMNQTIAMGHWGRGNEERQREFTHRTADFIQRLSYAEELGPAYLHISATYRDGKDAEEAMKWLQALEEGATSHHDLTALAGVHRSAGATLAAAGDLYGAISRCQQAVELFARIGDVRREGHCRGDTVGVFLSLGDLQKAEEWTCRLLDAAKASEYKSGIAWTYWLIGRISLCQGAGEKAVDALQKALQLFRQIHEHWPEPWMIYALGRAYLAQGDPVEALRRFQEAIALPWLKGALPLKSTAALSGLEEAYEDPEPFRVFCRRFREEHPQVSELPLVQWFLDPTEPRRDFRFPIFGFGAGDFDNLISRIQNGEWVWEDSFEDCSFTVQNRLEIHAANGRDLWQINWSAPRMLRPAPEGTGWATETVCIPISEEKPAIGGLLLWKDKENYLRLDRGTRGEREISFGGCLANQDVIIGRGRIPIDKSANQQMGKPAGRVFLRLERVVDRVNALCSADGVSWFTVGHVPFPAEDPVQVGLHAIGNIDRTIYHGAYPDGTAIRFESFQLWGLNR